jgi:hypothetical protein
LTLVEVVSVITSGTLIAADKVNGTNVYNVAGDKLGSIDDIVIDRVARLQPDRCATRLLLPRCGVA